MKIIKKVRLREKGTIEAVLFKGNSNYTSLEKAVNVEKNEGIKNVHIFKIGNQEWLRSDRDDKKVNNLKELAE